MTAPKPLAAAIAWGGFTVLLACLLTNQWLWAGLGFLIIMVSAIVSPEPTPSGTDPRIAFGVTTLLVFLVLVGMWFYLSGGQQTWQAWIVGGLAALLPVLRMFVFGVARRRGDDASDQQ